jgi:hypothetical protein
VKFTPGNFTVTQRVASCRCVPLLGGHVTGNSEPTTRNWQVPTTAARNQSRKNRAEKNRTALFFPSLKQVLSLLARASRSGHGAACRSSCSGITRGMVRVANEQVRSSARLAIQNGRQVLPSSARGAVLHFIARRPVRKSALPLYIAALGGAHHARSDGTAPAALGPGRARITRLARSRFNPLGW